MKVNLFVPSSPKQFYPRKRDCDWSLPLPIIDVSMGFDVAMLRVLD